MCVIFPLPELRGQNDLQLLISLLKQHQQPLWVWHAAWRCSLIDEPPTSLMYSACMSPAWMIHYLTRLSVV